MDQSHQVDVVVIGSGAAGLCAAIEAAQKGATVALFEKQPSLGGTSNFFSGIFAAESAMQKEQYITYSQDQAFKNFMDYNHWRSNPSLVRALISKSADTIAWLQEIGVGFSEVTINMPDAPRTYHVVKGGGEAVVKALVVRAKEKGVAITTASPVLRLVKGNNGPTAVVVQKNDEEVVVPCKAVIVASGGYANNKEWIKKYAGLDLNETIMPIGNTGKMGDGIRMAWEMGAAAEGMGILHVIRMGPFGPEFPFMNVVEAAAIQPVLWVDPKGERFCDEGIAYYDTSTGNINARFKKGYTFSIFDDNITQHFAEVGIFRGMGLACLPGWKLKELDTQLQRLLSLNSAELVGASSVEELAAKIGANPGTLKETVKRYNGFCARGRDDEFAKDAQYLLPLTGPQYYAVRARTGFLGTLGGVRVNGRTEAVDQYDSPIPGLYAVGLDAGGLHAESYSMRDTSGIASAFALISGRVAGQNAAKYVKE